MISDPDCHGSPLYNRPNCDNLNFNLKMNYDLKMNLKMNKKMNLKTNMKMNFDLKMSMLLDLGQFLHRCGDLHF